jgi:hypothetical protein
VTTGEQRNQYSDGYRHLVLELFERFADMSVEQFAAKSCIPPGTLKEWLKDVHAAQDVGTDTDTDTNHDENTDHPAARPSTRSLHIETILAAWKTWHGTFTDFCDHVRLHCHIHVGKTMISSILEAAGVRQRQPRPGHSPDELASRGSFETFFPHAQWVGDGTLVPIMVDGQMFCFNVELDVDASSGAFLGADVSPVEDSDAVTSTFRDAVASSGVRPLALLLDNKPSNHTTQVTDQLEDTLLIRATPFRGQNKAHVEGGFGLLKPTIEGIELRGSTPQNMAASFLRSLVTTWARTINHKPRQDRNGWSRFDLLQEQPTHEQIEQARTALDERLRKQQKARQTEAARQNPVVRKMLADAYHHLDLDDPDGHLLTATARYPIDAVVEAIAIYKARTRANTLPDTADARYLLGITKNIVHEREEWELALALWDERIAAYDTITCILGRQCDDIAEEISDPAQLIKAYVDCALSAHSRFDRFFWLRAARDIITVQDDIHSSFKLAARRIAATHSVHHHQRTASLRFLAAQVMPIS